jgi:hypothetical protein
MPNIYFCQPHAKNQGMLRAVISLEDCRHIVSPSTATYLGEQFPKLGDGSGTSTADFAVIRIGPEEANKDWRPGYYRFEADLSALNAQLLTLAR